MNQKNKIGCPNCTNGKIEECSMTGDGQPNIPVEIHTKVRKCEFCDGKGVIRESKLDEPKRETCPDCFRDWPPEELKDAAGFVGQAEQNVDSEQ